MPEHHNAPSRETAALNSEWASDGTPTDLTHALRELVIDELRAQRLTPSRHRRIEQYARAMGLSPRQFAELFAECSHAVSSGRYVGLQPPKPFWMSLKDWLTNKLRATTSKTPPRDG